MEYRWTERDMAELEEKHRDAYNFLLHRSLFNEYSYLATNEVILNEWQKKRLKELEGICGFCYGDIARANVADMFYDNHHKTNEA